MQQEKLNNCQNLRTPLNFSFKPRALFSGCPSSLFTGLGFHGNRLSPRDQRQEAEGCSAVHSTSGTAAEYRQAVISGHFELQQHSGKKGPVLCQQKYLHSRSKVWGHLEMSLFFKEKQFFQ